MLRFKTGDKHSPTAGGGVESPYSLSPIGQDSPLGLISPKMAHRKIARSPFKVSPGRARHADNLHAIQAPIRPLENATQQE